MSFFSRRFGRESLLEQQRELLQAIERPRRRPTTATTFSETLRRVWNSERLEQMFYGESPLLRRIKNQQPTAKQGGVVIPIEVR